jgi:hypothetical protein
MIRYDGRAETLKGVFPDGIELATSSEVSVEVGAEIH